MNQVQTNRLIIQKSYANCSEQIYSIVEQSCQFLYSLKHNTQITSYKARKVLGRAHNLDSNNRYLNIQMTSVTRGSARPRYNPSHPWGCHAKFGRCQSSIHKLKHILQNLVPGTYPSGVRCDRPVRKTFLSSRLIHELAYGLREINASPLWMECAVKSQ